MLEYVIEGFLMQCDMSGYDIKQNMNNAKFFNASFGSIYPALKKMEAEGLIKSKEIVEGGKYKKIYSLNEAGRDRFLEWLQKPPDIVKSDDEHLVKMSFYQYLPKEKVGELISQFIKSVNALIRRMEVLKSVLGENINEYQRATLAFVIDYYRFMKEWYQRFLEEMNGPVNNQR
ncbi:MAG: PadR family transcriptional regulator [Clostridiales bacterium]|nr:PadR family transcriptional regulator [Eubacteriales bacterium]MDH7565374.1 PadR family transcriptional regulator [Clostridiales bacterium]